MRHARAHAGALLLALHASAAMAQGPGPRPPSGTPSLPIGSTLELPASQAVRLASLRPESPEAYLLLGEEIMDASTQDAARRLALELFVRAMVYGSVAGAERETAISAAYALASMLRSPRDAQWVRGLAVQWSGLQGSDALAPRDELQGSEAIDAQVATLIGYIRSGEGVFARQLLRRPEVVSRLEAVGPRLVRWGYDPGARGLIREASKWPCGECGNAGVIRRPSGWRICPECSGTPGPKLSSLESRALMRVELWLLRGVGSSWAAEVAVDGGEPYLEQDDQDPAKIFGVDISKPRYVQGVWVAMPGTEVQTTEAPPSPPADDGTQDAKPALGN